MNQELPDVQVGFRKGRGIRDQITIIYWIIKKARWQYTALMYSFLNLEPVHCSMSGSNCCILTSIQISQEAGKVVWYSHLLKNFSQFVVIHKVKV